MKQCKFCWVKKPYSDFYTATANADGYKSNCKACESLKKKEYYLKNRTKLLEQSANYYSNNKEEIQAKHRKYNRDNWQATRNRFYEWRNKDVEYRLRSKVRDRISKALKYAGQSAQSSLTKLIGCDKKTLRRHLESQFLPGMSFENYGQWHVDHIKPLAAFNLSNIEELKEACHYTNLQPLWALDNLKKSSRCP